MPYPATGLYPAATVYPGFPVADPVGIAELTPGVSTRIEATAAATLTEGRAGATTIEVTGGR